MNHDAQVPFSHVLLEHTCVMALSIDQYLYLSALSQSLLILQTKQLAIIVQTKNMVI